MADNTPVPGAEIMVAATAALAGKPPRRKRKHYNATAPRPPAENQDLTTDPELLIAVQKRWGRLHIDLAAKDGQEVVPWHITPEMDSLKLQWPLINGLPGDIWQGPIRPWLNPPYSPDITPWAKKCEEWVLQASPGSLLFFLTPASIDAEWFHQHVRGRARVLALRSRPKFSGATHGFPKPMTLSVFDANWPEQPWYVEPWDWRALL